MVEGLNDSRHLGRTNLHCAGRMQSLVQSMHGEYDNQGGGRAACARAASSTRGFVFFNGNLGGQFGRSGACWSRRTRRPRHHLPAVPM